MLCLKTAKFEKDARRFQETPFRYPNEMAKLLLKAARTPSTTRTAAADVALITTTLYRRPIRIHFTVT